MALRLTCLGLGCAGRQDRGRRKRMQGKITGGRTAGSSGERSARHAYTKAVEWGYVNLHPVKAEVQVEDKKPERAT